MIIARGCNTRGGGECQSFIVLPISNIQNRISLSSLSAIVTATLSYVTFELHKREVEVMLLLKKRELISTNYFVYYEFIAFQ